MSPRTSALKTIEDEPVDLPELAANDQRFSTARLLVNAYNTLTTKHHFQADPASNIQPDEETSTSSTPEPPQVAPIPATVAAARPVTYYALQEWEGYVLAVNNDVLTARLVDLTLGEAAPEEQAEIPIDNLTKEQRTALHPGTCFSFTVGYERTPGGERKRYNRIIIRQLPMWTPRELSKARAAGKARAHALRCE